MGGGLVVGHLVRLAAWGVGGGDMDCCWYSPDFFVGSAVVSAVYAPRPHAPRPHAWFDDAQNEKTGNSGGEVRNPGRKYVTQGGGST